MPRTIRAAVCREFGKPLTIETVTLADPGPGEIQVDIRACAICHSDITYAEGGWGGELPIVFGHEAAGVVSSVGEGVAGLAVGDPVVVTLVRACHHCHYCSGGSEFLCEEVFPLDRKSPLTDRDGLPLGHGLRCGAFAEAVTVEASQVVKVDASIAFDVASLLACGVITGAGAVLNTAHVPKGAHVVVTGCGGVGLNAVQGARIAGAATITAIDISDEKLAVAREMGATHTVNLKTESALDIVNAATAGRGADYVFVTVGLKSAIDTAMDYIRKNGTVVIVGMPTGDVMAEYNPSWFAAWSQKIIGSKMGSATIAKDIPHFAALYKSGDLQLDAMISGRFALDQINEAIAGVKRGEALRNVIVFG